MIVPILRQFDIDNNVAVPSGKHSLVSAEHDRDTIVLQLIKYGVFESYKDHGLSGVRKPKSLINKLPLKDIQSWIVEHTERYFSL